MSESEDGLSRVVDALREPVALDAGLTRRVMAEIGRLPVDRPGPVGPPARVPWSRRRWTISVSPLGGLALAAGLAALVIGTSRLLAPPNVAPAPAAVAAIRAPRLTQFVLVAPAAASVALVGDFNDWSASATPLERTERDGVWWVTVPLEPGRYRYSFVVDGTTWRSDPDAPAVDDEFGRANSVVTIGGA
jgi:hypothetical protein